MGIVSSSAISHVTNKKQPKFQWNIDNDIYVNDTFVISKVFTFDKENFVALYNQQLFSKLQKITSCWKKKKNWEISGLRTVKKSLIWKRYLRKKFYEDIHILENHFSN